MDTTSQIHRNEMVSPSLARTSNLEQSQRRWGWIFISPWIIGFLAFIAFPMLASLVFTFTDFNLIKPDEAQFVGFENWERLFTSIVNSDPADPDLQTSIIVTLRFAVIALPLSIILPLLLAALLNAENLWAKRIFRTLFYLPYMIPAASFVYIWSGVLNDQTGWVNRFLNMLGIVGPKWLNDTTWIYPALVLVGLWGMGNTMLTMLAGMQNVPSELYEAAKVDGANAWLRFRKITVPMISPVIFYNLVLAVIALFRYFDIPYILKNGQGDPGNATLFYNIHFYRTSFLFQDMGYGAAQAWLLFLAAMAATIFIFFTARYWVYYAAGD